MHELNVYLDHAAVQASVLSTKDHGVCPEGFVIRTQTSFTYAVFEISMAKYG